MSAKRQAVGRWIKTHNETELVPRLIKECTDRTIAAGMCGFTPLMEGDYNIHYLGPVAIPGYIHPHRIIFRAGHALALIGKMNIFRVSMLPVQRFKKECGSRN
ncbi:LOW QUALITY PROTEIN: hypothetical protein PHMEG_00031238, partial [Phytophthora megakarya]